MGRQYIYIILKLAFVFSIHGGTVSAQKGSLYSKPEIMLGRIVKTNSFFPETEIQQRYRLNIGRYHFREQSSWAAFYSYPTSGISLAYAKLGNDTVFGNSYGIMPYIEFRPGGRPTGSVSFNMGLGVSYFDTPFDAETNPLNKAIGSHINWSFQLLGYYNFRTSETTILRIGGGYLHSSNAHTRLPNFGLNSGVISLSAVFLKPDRQLSLFEKPPKHQPNLNRHYLWELRQGFGFHELGGTAGPVGGKNKPVYSTDIAMGIIFRQYIKFYGGFTYRYYTHFHDYIIENRYEPYIAEPKLSSSSAHFFLGTEFLMGRVSINIQGGLTLYKPFYKEFDLLFQRSKPFDYWLKYLFPTRLGLKYYWFKTQYHPKNNVYVAAHINANFGEADFSEFSIGYQRRIEINK